MGERYSWECEQRGSVCTQNDVLGVETITLDWPSVVYWIQSILNQSPLRRLGTSKNGAMRTPLEAFTGMKPTRPILCDVTYLQYKEPKSSEEVRVQQVINIQSVQAGMDESSMEISEKITAEREKQIFLYNAKTNIIPDKF